MQTQPTHFITFHFGWKPIEANIKLMHVVIRQIMRQWERLGLVLIEAWSRVDEIGTRGQQVLHIHCLLHLDRKRLPYSGMIAEAQRLSGARRPFEVEWIKSESQAAWYVTKYATKGLHAWYPHARPWYTSQPSNQWNDWRFEPIEWTLPFEQIPRLLVDETVDEATGEVGVEYIGPYYIAGKSFAALPICYPCFIREEPRNTPLGRVEIRQEAIK